MPIQRRPLYVAEGFMADCDKLIERCAQFGTLNYEKFCDVWKQSNFATIYHGRASGAEIAELSEEVLHIAKHYMFVETNNFEQSVAGVFLTYALLHLQPYANFAALRMVSDDVAHIHRLAGVARRQRRCDVLFILASILIKGPCHFHAAERERGMEAPLRKYLEGVIHMEKLGAMKKGVLYGQDEELKILKEVNSTSKLYAQVKKDLCGPKEVDRSLKYASESFAAELDCSLRKLLSGDDESINTEDAVTEEASNVQSIKDRAMKNVVNPMKHLTGLHERKPELQGERSPEKQTDIKAKPGKVKTGSPIKALKSSSPRKRRAPQRKPRTVKKRVLADHYMASDESTDHEVNADLNMEEFLKGPKNTQNHAEADAALVNQRAENFGEFNVEIIDHQGTQNEVLKIEPNAPKGDVPRGSKKPGVDNAFKMPNKMPLVAKREQKKSIVKSKFKRMGMLPVANFDEMHK